MVYRANNLDKERIIKFLEFDKSMNLFALGDIINYDIDHDILDVYLDNELDFKVVYTIYRKHLVISAKKGTRIDKEFIKQLSENGKIVDYNGDGDLIDTCILEGFKKRKCYLLSLKEVVELDSYEGVEVGKKESIEEFVKSTYQVFTDTTMDFSSYYDELDKGVKKIYFIKEDNKIVSGCTTTAENKYSAMIVGVFTLEHYRNLGYAKKVVTKLCKDLVEEGKECCLFFDNPIAGDMYKSIGFKDIGIYTMVIKDND